jgi:putative endonuclease
MKEKQIKGWTRKKKEALIKDDFDELIKLAKRWSKPDLALY